ncbi:coat protein [ssRNA phage Gerhypos.4_53]|uniref:Coat protein n=2 Tax=Leviviricetes TaxID=2842243 RepID=A0A8S5L3G5_9VIRU|nr:coat protein [ssRNA phage Gerhypos.4_53]QDH89353.1 MAG: hypothetical protein H4Bulk47249_000002 [Leviviridae sp.]DAD52043.1 TPA_asm: coat protein [ssRNA phage Gerhypos.4_53]
MLSEPLSIVIGSDTFSLPRVKSGDLSSTYQSNDLNVILEISHTMSGKGTNQRVRTMVKLTHRKVVPDPLTAANDYDQVVYHSVIDRPVAGFTVGDVQNQVYAQQAFLSSTNVAKLFGLES